MRKMRNVGSRMNTVTNAHVSVLWMLMGGWNHQYATASTIIATMMLMTMAFLPMLENLSLIWRYSSVDLKST